MLCYTHLLSSGSDNLVPLLGDDIVVDVHVFTKQHLLNLLWVGEGGIWIDLIMWGPGPTGDGASAFGL